MQTVDRAGYLLWHECLLLHYRLGKGNYAPERECTLADAELEKGHRVAMTVTGRIVSHLVPQPDGSVQETAADHERLKEVHDAT